MADDKYFSKLIDALFQPKDSDDEIEELCKLSPASEPFVLDALVSERAWTTTFKSRKDKPTPTPVMERLLQSLESPLSDAALLAVGRLIDHPEPKISRMAAGMIVHSGQPQCIRFLPRIFNHSEEYTRSSAASTVYYAVERGPRPSDEFLEAVFPLACECFFSGRIGMDYYEYPKLLLAIDLDRAAKILSTEKALTVQGEYCSSVLKTLNQVRRSIDPALLDKVYQFAKARKTEHWRYKNLLDECLVMMALNPNDKVLELIKTEMDSEPNHHSFACRPAEAWSVAHGLDARLFDGINLLAKSGKGDAAWTDESSVLRAAELLEWAINDNSLSGVFDYESHWGTDVQNAIRGFELMGDIERTKILKEAVALFGPSGPSTEEDELRAQFERLSRKAKMRLGVLGTHFHECKIDFNISLARYAAKHPQFFPTCEAVAKSLGIRTPMNF
jgi:hypothetical protein